MCKTTVCKTTIVTINWIESLTKTISILKQLWIESVAKAIQHGQHFPAIFSRSIHFIPDYPIAPQIERHTPCIYQLIQVFLISYESVERFTSANIHIFKMAIFPQKFKMCKISLYVVGNSHIHLHFKFHTNPANGFETIGF